MDAKTVFLLCLISGLVVVDAFPGGHGGHHKKVIIHVPIHEKVIKHTHTKYVYIYHPQKEHHGWGQHYHKDPYGGDPIHH